MTIIACIIAIIVLVAMLSVPYIISYKIACRYAETLPESEREQFWNDYYLELSKPTEGGVL
jgi:hypothetical protein